MIKIRVPGPKSAHFLRPPARTHWLPTVALLATVGSHGQVQFCWQEAHGERHAANHIGGAPQRRIAVQWQPQIRPAGTRRQEERKKKKAPTHKKMCLTPRPGNPKTGCSNQPAPAHAAMHLCAALPQTRTRSSSRSQASRLPLRRAADEIAGRLRAGGLMLNYNQRSVG